MTAKPDTPKVILEDDDDRFNWVMIGSCTCGTKPPDVELHDPLCRYRVLSELRKRRAVTKEELVTIVYSENPCEMTVLAAQRVADAILSAFPGLSYTVVEKQADSMKETPNG